MGNHTSSKVVLDAKARLGEGAIWHPVDKILYWVNIEGKSLHVFDPVSQNDKVYDVFERIGTVVPVKSGGVLLALQDGIAHFDLESGQIEYKIDPEKDLPDNRFNDGKCDPLGNFWVGSMPLDEKDAVGSVYKISPDFSVEKMITGVTVSNGICWSLDCRTMYYIDSPTRKIVAYNFNKNDATISNPEVVVNVEERLGFPDGMTIDSNGMLWVALWGGGAVGCWNPKTGKLIESIQLPAINVTSCAFGGENLDQLYITSARQGVTPEQLEKYPNSGDVFMAEMGVKGIPACLFG
ncbi:SMP-30/gluconolactonase/LRE family protein [Reichenbachiella sp. MALMAid0571]|uniref:SMP-30/gluconolactonase/LRE family protein n=1 Tax=Reichenbachiella sp. MALMAid0571 TaxID=3143939 RepID=UPI0032DFE242